MKFRLLFILLLFVSTVRAGTSLTPPVAIPSGQYVAWSFPATVLAGPWDVGATNGSAVGTAFVLPSTDATALITFTRSRPLANWVWAVKWSSFPRPSVPEGAVFQKLYAVMQVTRLVGGGPAAQAAGGAGHSLNPWQVWSTGYAIFPLSYENFSGVFYVEITEATDFDWLDAATIYARLASSMFLDDMTDQLAVTALGFAVYYSSELVSIKVHRRNEY